MKKLLKIVIDEWINKPRDLKELKGAKEAGYNIQVIAKGEKTGITEIDNGYHVYRISTKPLGKHIPAIINRLACFIYWPYIISKFDTDVISGHDHIALFFGFLSILLSRKNIKLVYDSHELNCASGNKNFLHRNIVKIMEKIVINKCSLVIAPCKPIADKLFEMYNLKKKPLVIYNVPYNSLIDTNIKNDIRKQWNKYFEITNEKCICIIHGYISKSRCIKQILNSISKVPDTYLIILGKSTESYQRIIFENIERLGISNKVKFLDPVDNNILLNYVAAADVGFSLLENTNDNLRFSIPNKFFECIYANVPLIFSNYQTMRELHDKYTVGIPVDQDNEDEIAKAINCLFKNKTYYKRCIDGENNARIEISIDNEIDKIRKAYDDIKVNL